MVLCNHMYHSIGALLAVEGDAIHLEVPPLLRIYDLSAI